jgi:hypothetical protein
MRRAFMITHRYCEMEDCDDPERIPGLIAELEERTDDIEHSRRRA